MRQRGERASGIPLVAALGHGLENARLAAARVFSTWVLTARVFTSGVFTARVLASGVFTSGVFASGIFTARVLASGILTARVLAPRIFTSGLFLRDGQIDGVGALLKRHVQEGGFGNRSGELTVNSPVGGQNAVALARFIAGLRIQRGDLYLSLIADGGFTRYQ